MIVAAAALRSGAYRRHHNICRWGGRNAWRPARLPISDGREQGREAAGRHFAQFKSLGGKGVLFGVIQPDWKVESGGSACLATASARVTAAWPGVDGDGRAERRVLLAWAQLAFHGDSTSTEWLPAPPVEEERRAVARERKPRRLHQQLSSPRRGGSLVGTAALALQCHWRMG